MVCLTSLFIERKKKKGLLHFTAPKETQLKSACVWLLKIPLILQLPGYSKILMIQHRHWS